MNLEAWIRVGVLTGNKQDHNFQRSGKYMKWKEFSGRTIYLCGKIINVTGWVPVAVI
jgi:hypothetical protein